MADLIEFLRARLDEDEATALAVRGSHRWRWIREGDHTLCEGECRDHIGDLMVELDADIGLGSRVELFLLDAHGFDDGPAAAEHIARWDPARVLAEIAAKRMVIAEILEYEATIDSEWGCGHSAAQIERGECRGLCIGSIDALRAMAQPFADHPDFDPAWTVG